MTFEKEFLNLKEYFISLFSKSTKEKFKESPEINEVFDTMYIYIQKQCINKQKVKNIIMDLEEEFWHIIDEREDNRAYEKAIMIKNVLLEELKLRC